MTAAVEIPYQEIPRFVAPTVVMMTVGFARVFHSLLCAIVVVPNRDVVLKPIVLDRHDEN